MEQKWSFILYIFSASLLGYAGFMQSPFRYSITSWENTYSAPFFYGIIAILMIHIVYTGYLYNKAEYAKSIWISAILLGVSILLMFPQVPFFLGTIPSFVESYI